MKRNPIKRNLSVLVVFLRHTFLLPIFMLIAPNVIAQQLQIVVGDEVFGGTVFYVSLDGKSGKVISSENSNSLYQWGCSSATVSGTDSSFNTGLSNTLAIDSQCSQLNIAAKYALSATINGYSDWYLPSIGELKLAHPAIINANPYNYSFTTPLWSSSQFANSSSAYFYNPTIAGGIISWGSKFATRRVRLIRNFCLSEINILEEEVFNEKFKDTVQIDLSYLTNVKWNDGNNSLNRKIIQSGYYSFNGLDTNNCEVSDNFFVTINNPKIQVDTDTVCRGETVQLNCFLNQDTLMFANMSIGPSNGYIFYDKGNNSNNWRYLEASRLCDSGSFGCNGTNIVNANSSGVGFGLSNTQSIVSSCNQLSAAKRCALIAINGYNDFFLPSKDELNLIYTNLLLNSVDIFGGIKPGLPQSYWASAWPNGSSKFWGFISSTQTSSTNAYRQSFIDGAVVDWPGKTHEYSIKPVRRFSSLPIISWSNGDTGTATNVVVDSTVELYVRVDYMGLVSFDTVNIYVVPNADIVLDSLVHPTCNGTQSGIISLVGQANQTYTWYNDGLLLDSALNIQNRGPGLYTCLAVNEYNCFALDTFVLIQDSPILNSYAISPVVCNGGSDGRIDFLGTSAMRPLSFMINNSPFWDSISGLPANTYLISYTDSIGCTGIDTVMISEPNSISIQALNIAHVSCFEAMDGSVTVNVMGGNGGYVSSWKEIGTSSILSSTTTLSNVQAGVYRYVVIDSLGCTDSLDVTITQPLSTLTASISSKTDVLCNGDSTGSIIAQAIGGTIGSGYSYLWTNNSNSVVSGSSLASGLSAGIYNCQVTDVNGCTNLISDTILEPLTPVDIASSGVSDVLCYGDNDGSLWVTPSGGVAPYTYSWNTLGTNDTIDNLAAGSYSVIVTDSNGCTKNQSFVVTQPSVLTNSVTQSIYIGNTNISCPGGTDGYINLLPAGGTSPYSYSWSNLDTTQNITGLSPGSYTCTVTDANNCTSLANVSMTDPQDFVWSSSITDVSCNGLDDGAISLGISGGNQPYIIDWTSSPTSQGEVEVTFRLDMSQQSSFSASSVSNVVQGFMAPLVMSDLYNDSTFILSQKFNPGDTIYWRYFNGSIAEIVPPACGVNIAQSIFERYLIVPTNDTILPIVCFSSCQNCQGTIGSGLNGSIHNSTKSLSDIGAGIYTFNLLDRNGCTITLVDTVVEPASLVLTLDSISNVTCKGADDASVSVTVTGGNGNYSYSWNGVSASSEDLSNVAAGTHTLVVVDDKGCTDSLSVTVSEPDSLLASYVLSAYVGGNNVSCNGATDGSIDVSVQGGTLPYSYAWNTLDTAQDLSGIGQGYYSVVITDANACIVSIADSIVEPVVLTANISTTDVTCNGGTDGTVSVNVAGGSGPYTVNWTSSNGGQINSAMGVTFRVNMSGEVIDPSGVDVILGSGQIIDMVTYDDSVYYATGYLNAGDSIKYRYFNGSNSEVVPVSCGITQNLTLFERLLVVVNDTTLPATVFSSCSASKSGTSGYAISSTDSLASITSGTYTATLTDANGCAVSVQDSAVQPDVLVIVQDTLLDASCPQTTDGYIGVIVTGGTGNYSFDWSNGDTTQNITIGYGNHDLLVIDENGCQDSATFFVDAPFPYNDEEICVVTVDSTGVNMLVWDKTPGQRTSEYIILRENASTQYTSVGTSVFNNMSTYADQNSNPSVQPYRYMLVLQDSCGNYSDTSDYHSTIHLQASPGVAANEVQLSWTAYEGKAVQTYYIYRWLSPLNRILIDSVSSNVFTYTDIFPVTTTITALLYEVGAKFVNGGCSPTAGKQATYTNSMSNILDWGTDGGVSIGTDEWLDVVLEHDLEIYPNPTLGRLNLELKGAWQYQRDIQIKLMDITGRSLAYQITDGSDVVSFDLREFPAGIYLLNIYTAEGRTIVKRFEKVN